LNPKFDFNSLQEQFNQGLQALALTGPIDFVAIRDYLELLYNWNQAYNLTAIRAPRDMLVEHVFSSLAVIPYLKGRECLDVGSGAGIPGLILAMARPDTHWTLVDSNGKKTRFLSQVQMELELDNVEIVQRRIEEFAVDRLFSTIICRAWRSLAGFYSVSAGRLQKKGVILAMKPGKPVQELDELCKLNQSVSYHALTIPGLEQKRGLVLISTSEEGKPIPQTKTGNQ